MWRIDELIGVAGIARGMAGIRSRGAPRTTGPARGAIVDLGLRRDADQNHGAVCSPVGLVAGAPSGWASGRHAEALALLSRAEALEHAHPTYYSSA